MAGSTEALHRLQHLLRLSTLSRTHFVTNLWSLVDCVVLPLISTTSSFKSLNLYSHHVSAVILPRGLTPLSLLSELTCSCRETFEGIHLDLSKQPGKCKIAESGLGWKASGGGDPFTLDSSNIVGAQWSRAAKGYELKITSRTEGVVQLDGFEQEVSMLCRVMLRKRTGPYKDRTTIVLRKPSSSGMVSM